MSESPVFATYSAHAGRYDDRSNEESCWGRHTAWITDSLELRPEFRTVADLGCGVGGQIATLAARTPAARFIGVEPAENMRRRAEDRTRELPNVEIRAGAFESMPLEDRSIDYMYSINAFHWAPDHQRSLAEMGRVMRRPGRIEHCFIGRDIGREFIRATSPIFLRYMGPKRLLEAATMRHQYTRDQAEELFGRVFGQDRVEATEVYQVYHDTVEGHLGWWVRIEPQLLGIPEEKKAACFDDVRRALAALDDGQGVPYTMHQLRVRVRLD